MLHRAYVETVRAVSKANWGREYETEEEAIQALSKGGYDVTSAAMLEIVRRINQVIDALAMDQNCNTQSNESQNERPGYATKWPEAKVGDVLYRVEEIEEGGVCRRVVVSCLDDGYIRTATCDDATYYAYDIDWGSEDLFPTKAEALADRARKDVLYYEPRLDLMRRVLAAIDAGEDLEEFCNGVKLPSP